MARRTAVPVVHCDMPRSEAILCQDPEDGNKNASVNEENKQLGTSVINVTNQL